MCGPESVVEVARFNAVTANVVAAAPQLARRAVRRGRLVFPRWNQCDGGGEINHQQARGRHGQPQAAATEGVRTENQERGMA